MDIAQLQLVEKLTLQLYQSPNQEERLNAEKALFEFSHTITYLPHTRFILDHSSSPYAKMFAAFALQKLVMKNFLMIDIKEKIELRNYIIGVLGSRGAAIEPYVLNSLALTLCKITNLGWFESDELKATVDHVIKFLEAPVDFVIIGLLVLGHLVNEINSPNPSKAANKHRKIAIAFRDNQLLPIFKIGLGMLKKLQSGQIMDSVDKINKLKEHTMNLIKACLVFDFIGSSIDEFVDDIGTVQVPTSWRTIFEDPTTVKLFWDSYMSFSPPHSGLVMECLVQMASVRRSLFQEAEREIYLSSILQGVYTVLDSSIGLSDVTNFHELCRLLGRLKSTYQLSEIISCEIYTKWITSVAAFTIKSVQAWHWSPNSLQYLFGFWSKMISSTNYVTRSTLTTTVEGFCPEITKAYITSRLTSVEQIAQSGSFDDPLDDEESVLVELDSFANIARCKHEETTQFLITLFDPLAASYQEIVRQQTPISKKRVEIIEGQFTWLVYIIAKIVGGRGQYHSSEEHDMKDGDLSCKVLQLMKFNDMCVSQGHTRSKRLTLAFLVFFQQFRKIYIGDHAQKTSKVYNRLAEVLETNDQMGVLNLIVHKIASNLRVWSDDEIVIQKTLEEFQALTSGYSVVRLLSKLDTIQFLLRNFASDQFPFLENQKNLSQRSSFSSSLTKLLFSYEENLDESFEQFVKPLEVRMDRLLLLTRVEDFRSEQVKISLAGLFRDLHGIAMSCHNKKTYMLFFDWIFPKYMPLAQRAIQSLYDTPSVTTPILKFFAEFVQNKSQRLQFEISSANGILLFRETSELIVNYGNRILNLPVKEENKYPQRYKGISICLNILKSTLCGHYVNFGVFSLYGDKALENAISMFWKMVLSIPLNDLMSFTKLSHSYFSLLEPYVSEHLSSHADFPKDVFMYMMATISEGLRSTEYTLSSQVCSILDSIASFVWRNISKPVVNHHNITRYVEQKPDIFNYLLAMLYTTILFEDSQIQWSISRPMLPLILLVERFFTQYNAQLIQRQPADKQEWLSKTIAILMNDVERKLTPKNRDRFTQNVTLFRRDVTGQVIQSLPNLSNPFSNPL